MRWTTTEKLLLVGVIVLALVGTLIMYQLQLSLEAFIRGHNIRCLQDLVWVIWTGK